MNFIINKEIEFFKGNMSEVFSDGNIVYRKMKIQSKTIHRLLRHLENKNIDFVPHLLGIDEDENNEKLSLVEGQTLENYPIVSDMNCKIETIGMAAKMLRKYHDATLDFKRNRDDIWFLKYKGNLNLEVICHNDFAPYNITFRDHKPVGMIDFDTACPAPRIWDIAYAVYRFVPLSMEVYISDKRIYRKYDKDLDALERRVLLKEFLKSYGIESTYHVMENVILRLEDLVDLFDEECNKGNSSFIKMKEEGHQSFYINEIKFIKENMKDWI